MLRSQPYTSSIIGCSQRILGGYCGGVPPLPIPNREVKPTSADGTAMQCGRVGNRLLLEESSETKVLGLFFFMPFFKEDNPLFFIVEHYALLLALSLKQRLRLC